MSTIDRMLLMYSAARRLQGLYEKGTQIEQKREQKKQRIEQEWYKDLEYKYGKEFADWAKQNRDNVPNKYLTAGCKKEKEYRDKLVKDKGFEDWSKEKRGI